VYSIIGMKPLNTYNYILINGKYFVDQLSAFKWNERVWESQIIFSFGIKSLFWLKTNVHENILSHKNEFGKYIYIYIENIYYLHNWKLIWYWLVSIIMGKWYIIFFFVTASYILDKLFTIRSNEWFHIICFWYKDSFIQKEKVT
jgi:hypothetical protein